MQRVIFDISDWDNFNALHKAQIEENSYFNILEYLLLNNGDDKYITLYEEKYITANSTLIDLKNELSFMLRECLENDVPFSWDVDFLKKVAVITIDEEKEL